MASEDCVRDSKKLLNKRTGIPWKIYVSRALSAWGDRMWSFAGGVFMTYLDQSDSLRLVAIYGFAMSIVVIVLGAAVGNWIDRLDFTNFYLCNKLNNDVSNSLVEAKDFCLQKCFCRFKTSRLSFAARLLRCICG
jgi:hypothetical protein